MPFYIIPQYIEAFIQTISYKQISGAYGFHVVTNPNHNLY
jgi:hypothetical protein